MTLDVHPLTPARWPDLERLFGPRGADGGCWCMWLRVTQREFEANAGEGNRRALKAIVDGGRVPGLIAYGDGEPAGWVSVAPRPQFGRVERSPVTKPVDERPAWAIVCFFIAPLHRGTGVARALLAAAEQYAEAQGAELLEGYPVDTAERPIATVEAWHGTTSMFESAGFAVVVRRRERRPVMRKEIGGPGAPRPRR